MTDLVEGHDIAGCPYLPQYGEENHGPDHHIKSTRHGAGLHVFDEVRGIVDSLLILSANGHEMKMCRVSSVA